MAPLPALASLTFFCSLSFSGASYSWCRVSVAMMLPHTIPFSVAACSFSSSSNSLRIKHSGTFTRQEVHTTRQPRYLPTTTTLVSSSTAASTPPGFSPGRVTPILLLSRLSGWLYTNGRAWRPRHMPTGPVQVHLRTCSFSRVAHGSLSC